MQPIWPAHTEVVALSLELSCSVYSFGPRMPPPPNEATPTPFSDFTFVTFKNPPSAAVINPVAPSAQSWPLPTVAGMPAALVRGVG